MSDPRASAEDLAELFTVRDTYGDTATVYRWKDGEVSLIAPTGEGPEGTRTAVLLRPADAALLARALVPGPTGDGVEAAARRMWESFPEAGPWDSMPESTRNLYRQLAAAALDVPADSTSQTV